jgi:peptidyl-prolyl cis-trans isomerase C
MLGTTLVLAAWMSAPVFAQSAADTVLLRSDGVEVKRADIDAKLAEAEPEVKFGVVSSRKRLLKVLQNLLLHRVLAQEARSLSLDQDDVTRQQVQLAIEEALAKARVTQLTEQAKATAPDFMPLAREMYDANVDSYAIPERTAASHIMIGTDGRSDQEAAERAAGVRRMVAEGERPFSVLAKEFSDERETAERGGELNWMSRLKLRKTLESAASALPEPGAVSEPIRTSSGYHIVRLDKRTPARQRTFDEVKGALVDRLRRDHVKKVVDEHIRAILTKRPLALDEAALDDLQEAPPPIGAGHIDSAPAGG